MVRIEVHHYHHIVPASSGDSKLFEEIVARLVGLEKHMSKQDDASQAFQDQANAKLADLGKALDNISADEAKILADLQAVNASAELTPDNQAKLDAVLASLTDRVAKTQAIADSLPDVSPA